MTNTVSSNGFSAILMGDESLTIACGDMILARGHRIVAMITRDVAVRDWANTQNLPVFSRSEDVADGGEIPNADWLLSVANLRIIPDSVLALPTRGAINFHDGPLPRYAGLNTPAWAILNGEATHGVSWHLIDGGVDEGDLLAQMTVNIGPEETAFSLNSKCYAAGMESFADVLAQLESGTLDRTPQDLSQRSYFARDQRPTGMGFLDLTKDAAAVTARVRGLDFGDYANPITTAKVAVGQTVLRVGSIATVAVQDNVDAGQILSVASDQIVVATGSEPVALRQLTDLDGRGVDPLTLVAVGDRLGQFDFTTLDAASSRVAKAEPYWRRALQRFNPLPVPLSRDGGGTGPALSISLSCPDDLTLAQKTVAAGLVALRGAGRTEGDLAYYVKSPAPLISDDWVPVHIAAVANTPLENAIDDITAQLQTAADRGGFARDLPLRDPMIAPLGTPQFAISTTGIPIEGAAATLSITDVGAQLFYDDARLDAVAAGLIAARLEAAFDALPGAQTCVEVWSLPAVEQAQILTSWNATEKTIDPSPIHAAFEAQVAATPDAPALVFEGETLSYAALNARANRLAHVLRDMGTAPGTPVGLCTARSTDLLVGALGILKAGGAYVPLDPGYPAERIAHYITDSAAPIIVTQTELATDLPVGKAQVLRIDADPRLVTAPDTNPSGGAKASDLAYLIYTSGSTGTPKGVMVSHANVANFFSGMDDRIGHASGAVWLAVTSLSFDISVLELFWTLARGFKLVLAGDDSRRMISGNAAPVSDRKIDFNLFYWGNDDGVGPKKYELLLEGAKFADAHGFNAVWTPERHFHAFGGPYPNPSVTGAAVAAVTSNLSVRAGSCVAPLHHPARIAEEWAVIDNLTNGRVGLAIASGWQPDDFVLRPENTPPDNKPAMYAAIDQLRRLWRGDAVDFPTKDGTPFSVVTQPRPVSAELPIWVTTAGNPETWKEAGQIGANVLTHLLGQSVEEVAGKIEIYHAALRGAGHDPAAHKVTVMLHSYLADSREQAAEVARGPMKDYLRSAAGLIKQYAWAFPAFKKPAGVTNPFQVDLEGLSEDEMDAILEFAFERYFNDSGMFGTIDDGLARTEQLKAIGVDEIACLIDYGIPVDRVMAGLKPLAEVLRRANQGTVLADDDFSLAAQINRHDVSHLQCTPSMAQMLVADDATRTALGRIDQLMLGGEALTGTLVDALRTCTDAQIQNMYGPTETTIWSTTQQIVQGVDATVPIGTPIANTQIYVLDDAMQPVPTGAPGELWIGGDGVTLGYWLREAMTEERFVCNPFAPGRMYRTGDLVAWRVDGTLGFMGRADHQVKIRGHRIELGEIEARLASLPGVTQAIVVARDSQTGPQLIGYVTATGTVEEDAARAALSKVLPEIMVPARIVTLPAMPLTPNKKIDRAALPAPKTRTPARALHVAAPFPASATQSAIAVVWCRILGLTDVRAEDSFFALGGHSLLAVQAHREIKAALGADRLSITDIFRFPKLEGLAAHLDKVAGKSPIAAVQPNVGTTEAHDETMSKRRMMRAGRSKAGA